MINNKITIGEIIIKFGRFKPESEFFRPRYELDLKYSKVKIVYCKYSNNLEEHIKTNFQEAFFSYYDYDNKIETDLNDYHQFLLKENKKNNYGAPEENITELMEELNEYAVKILFENKLENELVKKIEKTKKVKI